MRQTVRDLAVTRQGRFVEIKNKEFQIKFNLAKGSWNYIDATETVVINNAYAKIVLSNGTVLTTLDDGCREFIADPFAENEFGVYQPVTFSHQAQRADIRIHTHLHCYSRAPYIILTVSVENCGSEPIALDRITLVSVSPLNDKAQGGVYLGGSPLDSHLFLDTDPIHTPGSKKIHDGFGVNAQHSMHMCYDGVLYDPVSHKSLVFGFLNVNKWWSAIEVGYDSQTQTNPSGKHGINHWALYHQCERQPCRPGEEVRSEPAYLNFASQAAESYQLYVEMLTKRVTPRKLEQVFAGWSAYPSHSDHEPISAKYVLRQVDQILENRFFDPALPGSMEYIQLEDGWQQSAESHDFNSEAFSREMKSLVDAIHKKGLKAGIRFAPFCIESQSELPKRHPEFFLRQRDRSLASINLPRDDTEVAVFDVSHPGAQKYIRERIQQIVDEWGCDLLKADLLAYALGPMSELGHFVWHDQSLTAVELYRLGVELLVKTIAESQSNPILAACNVGSGASIGAFPLVQPLSGDRAHIGSELWHDRLGLKQLVSGYAAYLAMGEMAWTSEFGALTIDEPRSLNEVVAAITIAALSGGVVTCADDLTKLKSDRAELLSKLFPLVGQAATPIDLYEQTFPRVWNLRLSQDYDSWNIVGVFNWTDYYESIDFKLNALGLKPSTDYLAHDFWERQYLGVLQRDVTLLDLPPRSGKLLCLRAARKTPQLLATDVHFTQGGEEILSAGWDAKSDSLLVVCKPLRQSKGTLFIHVPDNYVPAGVSCYGGEYQFAWKPPIYELTVNPSSQLVHASVRFSPASG